MLRLYSRQHKYIKFCSRNTSLCLKKSGSCRETLLCCDVNVKLPPGRLHFNCIGVQRHHLSHSSGKWPHHPPRSHPQPHHPHPHYQPQPGRPSPIQPPPHWAPPFLPSHQQARSQFTEFHPRSCQNFSKLSLNFETETFHSGFLLFFANKANKVKFG